MDRNLALELIRVTEAAALASARWMGKGQIEEAYHSAEEAVTLVIKSIPISGCVTIGKSRKRVEKTPEQQSGRDLNVDVVLDPLHSVHAVAYGWPNAISVIAVANKGAFFDPPVPYLNTIVVGPEAVGRIDIRKSALDNLVGVADAKRCYVEDLTVTILDRDRNHQTIADVRESGARVQLIRDGDVAAAIAASVPGSGVDLVMGIGSASACLLSAAAVKCAGGDMQAQLHVENEEEKAAVKKSHFGDPGKVLGLADLIGGDEAMLAATAVTDSEILRGVQFKPGGAVTHSIVMRQRTGTIRLIEAKHRFDRRPDYK
jgi:fructose-1,6-bisphosphatase II